jgi:hypothetical protein
VPIPYAIPGNPQTLNLYSYVENNPITGTDPDGHCCDWQYVAGAVQAWASDNFAAGAFHGNSDNPSFQAGQIAGDRAALAQGAVEVAAGQAGVGGGTALTLSVAGAPEGALAIGGGALLEGHGAMTATAAGIHLMAETAANNTQANSDDKTHQTYTKTNPETGEVYSGKTSGTGTSEENVAKRDANHHMSDKGFGPAELDKSSTNANAIRGREQQNIEKNGGAKSQGGTSGNAINSVSRTNPKAEQYRRAAEKEFEKK